MARPYNGYSSLRPTRFCFDHDQGRTAAKIAQGSSRSYTANPKLLDAELPTLSSEAFAPTGAATSIPGASACCGVGYGAPASASRPEMPRKLEGCDLLLIYESHAPVKACVRFRGD